MADTINQEWLNQNALRAYPFKEDASRKPINVPFQDTLVIPNYLLVDCVICTPYGTDNRAYLYELMITPEQLVFTFNDSADATLVAVTVALPAHVTNAAYNMVGTGAYADVRGTLVLGDLTYLLQDMPPGLYNFDMAGTELEIAAVRPMLRAVTSLQLYDAAGTPSAKLFSNIKLLAGNNTRLTYIPTYNCIRVDAIAGAGLNDDCGCSGIDIYKPTVVNSINGVSVANVELVGDGECITVDTNTGDGKITIGNTCTKPCCGCQELELLTTRLAESTTLATTLESQMALAMDMLTRLLNEIGAST